MQYTHRKLHRSVTEMRRSRIGRENASVIAPVDGRRRARGAPFAGAGTARTGSRVVTGHPLFGGVYANTAS
ncbi:hypothetical protein GCM10009747_05910 [Agromyces humatus]|uniref:Uncharacterized protein n=1 Tax=Agromyces humatus TaxID=279573 RepID=A0ABN2K9P9_9MICO